MVGAADEVARALGGDLQVLDLAEVAQQRARRRRAALIMMLTLAEAWVMGGAPDRGNGAPYGRSPAAPQARIRPHGNPLQSRRDGHANAPRRYQ